jgi:hypothetical protein
MAARGWKLQEGPSWERLFAAVLRKQLGLDGEASDRVHASFAAAVSDEALGATTDAWAGALRETLLECGLDDEDDAVLADVIGGLRKAHVILEHAELAAPLPPGARVLALLAEDADWHEAVVESVVPPSPSPPARATSRRARAAAPVARALRYRVLFPEFGNKPQVVGEAELVDLASAVADDDDCCERGEGECAMCARIAALTFHHLIPRDTHAKYVGKALPAGVAGEPSRLFLGTYGMLLCRPCHSHVHRVASNNELAERYSTPADLLAHPEIERYLVYATKRRR